VTTISSSFPEFSAESGACATVANGVAVYADGLFQPPIVTTNQFYDIADIEVLRGPQGTLVGSNSTGGAIFINSQSPKIGVTDGYVRVGGGNYGEVSTDAAVTISATGLCRSIAQGRRRAITLADGIKPDAISIRIFHLREFGSCKRLVHTAMSQEIH
jgi:hypothetical protein